MSEGALRCEGCRNLIDEEDLFCSNCGRQAPERAGGARDEIEEGFIGFDCETCGASLTYDAEAEGLRCAFCGSVTLKRQPQATGRIKAETYLPFDVPREQAVKAFERWISRSFFRPFGFKEGARIVDLRAVYVPAWCFRARTHTYYAGDSSRTPPLARADWCPVAGERSGELADVLVPASGMLSQEELAAIEPFDFARRRPYRREELRAHAVEDFGLSRRGARPRARALMLEAERRLAAELIPGSSRNVRVNTLFTDIRSSPVLLPIWINAYRFRETTYRFLVNGQTGELVGRAPFSLAKLGIVVAAAAAVLAAAAAVVGVAAGAG
ncbi:MAG: hypothetical protein HY721_18780 [Planctomycetes bacterium]|nr:hypothetical protein [Planctomycetota bacterium]